MSEGFGPSMAVRLDMVWENPDTFVNGVPSLALLNGKLIYKFKVNVEIGVTKMLPKNGCILQAWVKPSNWSSKSLK